MILTVAETRARADAILDEIERAVVGKRDALRTVLLGLLADGHVLIDDVPGRGRDARHRIDDVFVEPRVEPEPVLAGQIQATARAGSDDRLRARLAAPRGS